MTERFVFSGSFDTANMTPEQREVFTKEVAEVFEQSLAYVLKWGRDSEHGPIEAFAHNIRVTVV